jgi:hypothetical protein
MKFCVAQLYCLLKLSYNMNLQILNESVDLHEPCEAEARPYLKETNAYALKDHVN